MMMTKGWMHCGMVGMMLALGAASAARAELTYQYSFKDGAKDSVGKVDGTLKGDAKIADGKLTLDNADKTSGDAGAAYLEFSAPILPKQGSATIVVSFTAKEVGAFSRLLDIGAKEDASGTAFVYLTARNADDASRAAISASDAASKSAVDGARLDDGKPHMAALVIDATAKKLHLYVDGKEMGTATDLGDNTLDKVKQEHAWVGRSGFDNDPALTATISEVRVYDEALTLDQASALFKAAAAATQPAK